MLVSIRIFIYSFFINRIGDNIYRRLSFCLKYLKKLHIVIYY
ncbi:hypothetical protein LEP1GSC168_2615 [Leptospira santarosai str. HAI134]|nr:hypothetical protein LEP1GSC168_2615 [Leptospira santarosai str. HAI134]